jgi:phage terminase large subunit-like protein
MNNHEVVQLCRDLFAQYPKPAVEIDRRVLPGPAFCFDPWRFRTEADMLEGEGLAMVEVPQTDVHMVPASQALFEAIINRQIAHDGDVALKRHIYNTTARARERGWRIDRPEGTRRPNDATVALALALLQAQQGAPTPPGIMWV